MALVAIFQFKGLFHDLKNMSTLHTPFKNHPRCIAEPTNKRRNEGRGNESTVVAAAKQSGEKEEGRRIQRQKKKALLQGHE